LTSQNPPKPAVSIRPVLLGAGQIAVTLMDAGRWHWGEFAGRRTETGAAPFPAAGT
jgi:hypothetical protein